MIQIEHFLDLYLQECIRFLNKKESQIDVLGKNNQLNCVICHYKSKFQGAKTDMFLFPSAMYMYFIRQV